MWRKSKTEGIYIEVDNVLKCRDITLRTKVHLVKAMVFPIVMYGCESWTIKKAEHQRIDALELVLEKTLESPLDCREIKSVNPKGNQSLIFTGRTNVEAPILWPPDPKIWLSGKDLNAGKERGQEEERMRWLDGITNSMNMNLSKPGRQWRTGSLACCSSWSRRVGHNLATE